MPFQHPKTIPWANPRIQPEYTIATIHGQNFHYTQNNPNGKDKIATDHGQDNDITRNITAEKRGNEVKNQGM